ncbi:MAG: aminomethyl-transferring glycine dehydrogenase subunit GcvPA [Deltaproteobacteria bacterium]|nr:aminomethyl-transferring glycine dehydrogenase subunit GcvPA [Deltaproteobacteria bacterium]
MRYLPHTEDELHQMLERVGVSSIDQLFEPIPQAGRLERALDLPEALDELSLMAHLDELASQNHAASTLSFLGAGMYDHHIPPAVDQLLLRSEFYTAYTPYQPELSQGTLQATFEFQTLVAQLYGMEVANSSMYDGASAMAEAALMARRVTKREGIVLGGGMHPDYAETLRTYLRVGHDSVQGLPLDARGVTSEASLREAVDEQTAAVLIAYPNFFGAVEDLRVAAEIAHEAGALLVSVTPEVYALSVLTPPGELGADIAVGEGQSLATGVSFGGPGVGLFTTRQRYVRQVPGRLVGQTVDSKGERGFVLTLSTREQHIRRARATSNICTNHALVALAFAMRTAMLGRRGFEAVGRICLSRTEYLKARLLDSGRFSLPYSAPTFNEFVVRRSDGKAAPLLAALAAHGIHGGVDLGRFDSEHARDVLIAVTERHSKADLDRLVDAMANA